MAFLSFVALVVIGYFLFKISTDVPDIVFRLADIQRELSLMREKLQGLESAGKKNTSATPSVIQNDSAQTTSSQGGDGSGDDNQSAQSEGKEGL